MIPAIFKIRSYKLEEARNLLFNAMYDNSYSTQNIYVAYLVNLHTASIKRRTYFSLCFPALFISIISPRWPS